MPHLPIQVKPIVVDIYHGDKVTSFTQAQAAGLRGIIHKASEGTGIQDHAYPARRMIASTIGLLWGAYHFINDQDVEAQVTNFLVAANPDDKTLVALDWEPYKNHTASIAQAHKFLEIIAARLKRKAVLYSGNLAKEQLGGRVDPFFGSHRLWLCEYGPRAIVQASWKQPWLWQYAGDGIGPAPKTVPGIPGAGGLDCNHFFGTPEELAQQWAT